MCIRLLTYEQGVVKCYHSGKHFSDFFLPTRWRQKSTSTDMEQNYVTVTQCIGRITIAAAFAYRASRGNFYARRTVIKRNCYCSSVRLSVRPSVRPVCHTGEPFYRGNVKHFSPSFCTCDTATEAIRFEVNYGVVSHGQLILFVTLNGVE